MNVGDDVTINGRIIATSKNSQGDLLAVKVRLKSGDCIIIGGDDVNTVRPFIPKLLKDERKGN